MNDPLGERIEGLRRAVEALRAAASDETDRSGLEAMEARLARLYLAYIVAELEEEDDAYAGATLELDRAILAIDAAKEDMARVSSAIRIAAQSVAVVEKAVTLVP
jgi:hypothetical protein